MMHAVIIGTTAGNRGVVPGSGHRVMDLGAECLPQPCANGGDADARLADAEQDADADSADRFADLVRRALDQLAEQRRRREQRLWPRIPNIAQDLRYPAFGTDADGSRAISLQALEISDPGEPHAEPKGVKCCVAGHHAHNCEETRHQSVGQLQILAGEDV